MILIQATRDWMRLCLKGTRWLRMTWRYLLAAILLPNLSAQPVESAGQPVLTCIVCAKSPLSGQVWRHKLGFVCDECHSLKTRCAHCGLPVKEGFVKTSDGRLFCRVDHPKLILSTNEAVRVFHETVQSVLQLTDDAMKLRQPVVTVSLFDIDYWNSGKEGGGMHRHGFSHSRPVGGQMSHTVVLLSGLDRDQMRSVCAHEYTHLWINENQTGTRELDPDTREGICELIAHRLATSRRDTNQVAEILANPYTRGMITNLVALESRQGLDAILAWVRKGTAPKPDDEQLAALGGGRAQAWAAPVITVPRALPDDLIVGGLLGNAGRRVAMINGVIFKASDRRRLQLKSGAVTVRCLEILENGVSVQVNDDPEPRFLPLGGK